MRAETNLTAQRLAVNIMWSGDDMRVIPGYGFRLEGHDTPAFNQEWLVVRVAHRGSQIGVLEEDSVERGMIEDETSEKQPLRLDEEIAKHKRAVQEAEDKMKKHEEIPEPEEDRQFTQKLGYELDDTPGIKAHICTLVADNAWQEVYVHSKITIIDDVFTVISSANLNTRSMEKDTELGIILEAGEVARDLRKRLWGLHTKQNAAAYPEGMYNYNVAEDVFDVWGQLLENNRQAKKEKSSKPLYPLRQFFRPNPKVSRAG